MTYLTEVKAWGPGVYQLEQTDPVIGGPGGVDNWQAQELANRSAYLKNEVEKRAPLASPALTGTPTAPTASAGTTTTQIATTAFVQQEIGGTLIKDISGGATTFTLTAAEAANSAIRFGGVLTNNVTVIFPTGVKRLWVLDNYTQGNYTLTCRAGVGNDVVITQGYKKIVAVGESLLYQAADDFNNINLTGTPQAPTAAVDTSTTQIATTEFVANQASNAAPLTNGTAAPGTSKRFSRQDHVHPTDATRAPLASPALTGTPTAPTASAGTTTQQIATTAFVQQEIGGALLKDISGGATTFTLTAAEAANSVIRFGGVLTNNVTVIFPTGVKRLWVLDNYTQGNYTLTCRAGVGNDVVITQGYKKIVTVGESYMYQAADDFNNINLTGTPQAPTAAAGTSTTQIATTAFVSALVGGTVAASSSLAAAGYQKFPSGLIIQWGSSVTSGTTVSVTFPVAFSSACYVAIPVNFGGSFLYVCPTAVSKTAATFSANGSNQSFYWIAIGK